MHQLALTSGALALRNDRCRSLALTDEASTQAKGGDHERHCECNLFHGIPHFLNSRRDGAHALYWASSWGHKTLGPTSAGKAQCTTSFAAQGPS